MSNEQGTRLSAMGMVIGALTLGACGTQPITLGESDSGGGAEPVAEQREALGTTSRYVLSDGLSTFAVKTVEGGAVKAPVVSTGGEINGPASKHLGARQIEPVTVPLGLGVPTTYLDWAKAGLNGQFSKKDLAVAQCDADSKEVLSRSFGGSVLTGLSFGPFDAAAPPTFAPLFQASFVPERVTTRAGSGSACRTAAIKSSYTGQYSMTLDGVDAAFVAKIDEFKLTRVTQVCSPKELGCSTQTGNFTIPTLRVSIAESHVDSWLTWFNDFVVNGNDTDDKERNGEISLLSPDLKTAYLRIGLSGVGISRLTSRNSDVPGNDIPANRWVAELYVERVTLTKPAAL